LTLGFTGTQIIPLGNTYYVSDVLQILTDKYHPSKIVTGGCIGIDSYVHHWYHVNHPDIHRVVTLPKDLSKVDMSVCSTADTLYRDQGSYRDRNKHIVALSDNMVAFWTGKTIYSGTFMTMNISYAVGKLDIGDIYGVGCGSSELREIYRDLKSSQKIQMKLF
jgi:hypothetical protein